MFYGMAVFNIFTFPAEAAAYHHKEDRDEEDSQNRCGDHPAHYASTYGVLCARTGSGADNQWLNAQNDRQRGHEDRT